MGFTTDERGRLALRGIHDGQIAGFALNGLEKTIYIRLASSDDVATDIKATNLYALNISGLWEGSIVSDVFVWDFESVPEPYMFDSELGWRHLFEGRIDDRKEIIAQVERYKNRLSKGKLVSIGCSYGGNISFLCEKLVVEQEHLASQTTSS